MNNACDFLGLDKALFQWKRECNRQQDPKSKDADSIYGSNVGYNIPKRHYYIGYLMYMYVYLTITCLYIQRERERKRERERERERERGGGERDFGDALFLNVMIFFLYA